MYFGQNIKNNKNFFSEAILLCPMALTYCNSDWQKEKQFIRKLISVNPLVYQYVLEEFKKDMSCVIMALRQNEENVSFVPKELLEDPFVQFAKKLDS